MIDHEGGAVGEGEHVGWWPRSPLGSILVEGAPEPALSLPKGSSLLGTGEVERIHSGSCRPLCRAVGSGSIATVPRAVRPANLRVPVLQGREDGESN